MVRHSSRISLSQSALANNISFIRKKIGVGTRISSVVKANAYGHGIEQFVPMAEQCGVDHFAVASAFEAQEVLKYCAPTSKIMIMGILYDCDIPWAIDNGIEFYVFNYSRLPKALEAAQKLGKKAIIHLEVETGANRTGMWAHEFPLALDFMKQHATHLAFEGLCTHFGGAEHLSNKFKMDVQHKKYEDFLQVCHDAGIMPRYRHIACSAAIFNVPGSTYDMVRVGILQYGYWPSPDTYAVHLKDMGKSSDNPLRRIFTWKTDIMDIRKVLAGEFIGYGTTFHATKEMRIAVLPLGYSNGYPRGLSNQGKVLIGGKIASVVGLINMNLFMVDITHIPDVEIGDEVVLVGTQQQHTLTVASFTDIAELVNTEMLSRLPAAIPRKVVS